MSVELSDEAPAVCVPELDRDVLGRESALEEQFRAGVSKHVELQIRAAERRSHRREVAMDRALPEPACPRVGTTSVPGEDDNGNVNWDNPKYVGQYQWFHDHTIYDNLRNAGEPVTLIHRFADLAVPNGGDPKASAEYGFGAVNSSLDPKYTYCILGQDRTGDPLTSSC